jgi:hypothetical protein
MIFEAIDVGNNRNMERFGREWNGMEGYFSFDKKN